jgi:hypothetical protein
MSPNIYKLFDLDISGIFNRIDSFLGDNTIDLIENQPILNENNIKTIKILISDLTALEGLNPKELQKREQLTFRLISMIRLYYLSKTEEIDVMNNFFLIPEKA